MKVGRITEGCLCRGVAMELVGLPPVKYYSVKSDNTFYTK